MNDNHAPGILIPGGAAKTMIITSSDLINIDYNELAVLKQLALKGALEDEIVVTCAELAENLDVSAQTISRRLRKLEKNELLSRTKVADGQRVFITNHGMGILVREHGDYEQVVEPFLKVELTGYVTNGMGKAGEYLSLSGYTEQFKNRLGYEPYPGTLNVSLDESSRPMVHRLDAVDPVRISSWSDGDESYGGVSVYTAIVTTEDGKQYSPVHILKPDETTHDDVTLEIIAPVKLRDELELDEGDTITMQLQSHRIRQPQTPVEEAIEAFQNGEPVLVHDFDEREDETDLIYPAAAVTPRDVSRLRNDAGGLICVALAPSVADAFDLDYYANSVEHPAVNQEDLAYDERSSFSLTVNHRDTYTGITDEDRALTISSLGEAAADPESLSFESEFRIPGHVSILRGSEGLIETRRGHTELGLALAEAADREPAVVVCEMLDDETGKALGKADAQSYAKRYDMPFVDGSDVVEALSTR